MFILQFKKNLIIIYQSQRVMYILQYFLIITSLQIYISELLTICFAICRWKLYSIDTILCAQCPWNFAFRVNNKYWMYISTVVDVQSGIEGGDNYFIAKKRAIFPCKQTSADNISPLWRVLMGEFIILNNVYVWKCCDTLSVYRNRNKYASWMLL